MNVTPSSAGGRQAAGFARRGPRAILLMLVLLAAAMSTSACVDTNSRYWREYEAAYKRAYDEAYHAAYTPARDAAFRAAEPVVYERTRARLVTSGRFSYNARLMGLAGAIGVVLGFFAQYLLCSLIRRTPPFRDDIDRRIAGATNAQFDVRRIGTTTMRVALLGVLLSAQWACDGGASRGAADGAGAGKAAGAREGQEAGQRDGLRQGTDAGELRATLDARRGELPEIYVTPVAFATVGGLVLGILAQHLLFMKLRAGVQVPELIALIFIPGLGRSRIYRAWKAQDRGARERRIASLVSMIGGAGGVGRPPAIDVTFEKWD